MSLNLITSQNKATTNILSGIKTGQMLLRQNFNFLFLKKNKNKPTGMSNEKIMPVLALSEIVRDKEREREKEIKKKKSM